MKAAPFLALFGLSLLVTLGMIIPEIHLLFGKARVTHQYVRREAQRTIARQCFEDPPRVSSAPPCTFQGCPSGGPFLYVATAYRNRAASYNRWLRTFAIDIQSPLSPVHPSCVCALIANFNDEESGPSLDAALEDWPYESQITNVSGKFLRAGSFQILIDAGVWTPPQASLVMFMDADMVAYPGYLERVFAHVEKGVAAFAPACWSSLKFSEASYLPRDAIVEMAPDPPRKKVTNRDTQRANDQYRRGEDWYDGMWRSGGTGMITFYYSDFLASGGCVPLPEKTSHGGEDHAFVMAMLSHGGIDVRRECTPELWHLYHPKVNWGVSSDGLAANRGPSVQEKGAWKLLLPPPDGAAKAAASGDASHGNVCYRQKGTIYV